MLQRVLFYCLSSVKNNIKKYFTTSEKKAVQGTLFKNLTLNNYIYLLIGNLNTDESSIILLIFFCFCNILSLEKNILSSEASFINDLVKKRLVKNLEDL